MNLRVAVTCEIKLFISVVVVKASLKRALSTWRQTRNRVSVEKLPDEVCVGVKGQSNSEIARTPRKAFRCRVQCFPSEVERPIGCEGFTAYQVLTNSECCRIKLCSKGMGAKVRAREEKNPDRRLRSRNSV